MEKQKRERNANFSQEETDYLISLIEEKKHVIENDTRDAATWKDKDMAWKDIEKAFNSISSVFRHHKHLKAKYEAIKRDIKRKAGNLKTGRMSTAPVLTPVEQKVTEIILSVHGNESFNSDSIVPRTLTSDSCLPAEEQNDQTSELKFEYDSSYTEDGEPPTKKVCEVLLEETQSKPKGRRHINKLIEEKMEIIRIKKNLLTEDLKQKLLQTKIFEKELEHKDVIHELEKQHLLIKIELLKRGLEEK